MATKYYAVLTNVGAAKLANATALGAQVEITQMAVGDGNGALPTPNPAQTALVHELRRAPLNSLSIDPNSANQIIAEQVIPEDVGGWWIREIGLFDKDGDMIAVANCAETYKPQLQEGSGRVQVVRMILIVSSTAAVTLKIDPSVVLATRQYVDSEIIEAKAYTDKAISDHVEDDNPHDQYPLIINALKEMADAGLIDKVFENLGLGSAAKKNVGNGSNQIPDMNSFPASKSKSGWTKLPNGMLFQWGTFSGNSTSQTSGSYPIAFPSAVYITTGVMSDSAQFNRSASTTAINMENTSLTTWGANLTDVAVGNTFRYAFWAIGV
ncbi:phage tail protein [Serratia sarumanii]|uniref:phage tail protein n=1 Tax=Serratia sarumanii TaxID=3020826 RepID=UPI003F81CB84